MSDHRRAMRQGRQLAEDGDVRGAYLTFREGAVHAEEANDFEWAMRGLAGALTCHGELGLGSNVKLGILLDLQRLMNQYPESIFEIGTSPLVGFANNAYLEYLISVNPDVEALENCINKFKRISATDFYRATGEYRFLCGDWESALEMAERAQSVWNESSSLHRLTARRLAFRSALAIGRLEDCRSWMESMEKGAAGTTCNLCLRSLRESRLELGLAEREPIELLRRELDDLEALLARGESVSEINHVAVRVQILDDRNGSLKSTFHPARQDLSRRRMVDPQSLCSLWERSLSVLRYRLASVCWNSGFRPVDDYSFMQIVDLPRYESGRDASHEKLRILLSKAEAAARRAEFAARILDERLGCKWRQEKVKVFSDRVGEFSRVSMGR